MMVKISMLIPIAVLSLMMSATDVFLLNENPESRIVNMTPNNPKVKEFGTLVLNCTLTSYYKGSCNASDLYVQHNNQDFRYPFTRAITNETAEFHLPNMTVDHNGRFACALESSCNASSYLGGLAAQSVHVARDPLTPFLIGCTVVNWEYLFCTWGPSKLVQDNHTCSPRSLKQLLLWQHPGDDSSWKVCPYNTSERCLWQSAPSFTMTKEYCIKIVVSNAVSSNISSEVTCINPEFLVKPNPPSDIGQMAASASDGRTLGIEWEAPTSKPVSLIYRLTVRSKREVRNFTVINDTFLSIPAVPYTYYDISIVAFPSVFGFSSGEASTRLLTASTVPSANPVVMANFYYANADERAVVLYWKPILEESYCGAEFCYSVRNRASDRSYDCVSSKYSAVISWIGDAVDLLIVSQNEIGLASRPSLAIHVPSNDDLFSGFEVVAEGRENFVSVEWFLENSSAEREIESVMFFWCQSESFHVGHCKTPIQERTVNTSQYDFNLTLDENFRPFQFGVSVKLSVGSYSGIKWAKNKYTSAKIPDAPSQLQASAVPGRQHELRIKWTEPQRDESKAFIRSFVIFYCSVDDQDQCLYGEQSVTVFKYRDHIVNSGYDIGSFILNELESNTKYKIWMLSKAKQSSSMQSEYTYGTTTEPWFNPGKIVGIVIGILCAAAIVIFGLCVSFRYCIKCRKKFYAGFTVSLPPQRFQLPSTSSEDPMLRDTSYWRHPSQVSTISRDSGHYSFPPSSPAKLPLLAEEYVNLKEKTYTNGGVNRYQTANFCDTEKVPDDDRDPGSRHGVTSYVIVPVKTQCGQTQYILPEQLSQMGNGAVSAKFCNYFECETGNNNVDYCNDLHVSNANDSSNIGYTKIEQLPSDIGYTKIEQLPVMVNQGSKLSPDVSSTDCKDEDSNLIFCFNHHLGEFDPVDLHSVPPFSHHDELLVTSNQDQATAEPLTVDDNYPQRCVANVVEENVPLHSKQGINSIDSKVSESIILGSEDRSCDNGYLPHNRLFGID